ncbi:hypothetical protein J9305_04515 [Leptospira interrogans]|uniref:hypothetical protein n=1 Tax=Leptospira interrogans TaxID=173 RepID=UPI0002783839|nr:hypothetical protein [Leptospira interrogans]EJP05570.1 hypothetical protein LEP1GSC007_1008 [Leptospira interrogans serovar Bulgarica str. Mallika]UID84260.1 hypothetical protein J9305_04515 [Leptospira interrogans]
MLSFHLELLDKIFLKNVNQFVVYKDYAFVYGDYGQAHEIHILSLEIPEKLTHVQSISFQKEIVKVEIKDDTLYVIENERALHIFDLSNVSDPKRVDSFVLLGYDIYDMKLIGENAILAMNWEGIGLVDLNLPDQIQPVQKLKIENKCVECFVPFGDRIFTVSNLKNDPFLYEVSIINGYLEIKNKKEFSDFNPSNVFCGASEIILYGEFKKGKNNRSGILLLDYNLQSLGEPIRLERSPIICFQLSDGNFLFGFDYSYVLLDKTQRVIVPLFAQFKQRSSNEYVEVVSNSDSGLEPRDTSKLVSMDSLQNAHRLGDFFFALHGNHFISFKILENSLFRNII